MNVLFILDVECILSDIIFLFYQHDIALFILISLYFNLAFVFELTPRWDLSIFYHLVAFIKHSDILNLVLILRQVLYLILIDRRYIIWSIEELVDQSILRSVLVFFSGKCTSHLINHIHIDLLHLFIILTLLNHRIQLFTSISYKFYWHSASFLERTFQLKNIIDDLNYVLHLLVFVFHFH